MPFRLGLWLHLHKRQNKPCKIKTDKLTFNRNGKTKEKNMSATKEIVQKIRQINWKGQIIGLTYRSKKSGELARYRVQIGVSYKGLLEKDLTELQISKPKFTGLELQACDELIASVQKSLAALDKGEQSEDYTKKGQYQAIDGTPVQVSLNDGTFELKGLVLSKTVLEPGTYEKVNSKPLTLAKKEIEKTLRKSKFRTFAIDADAFESARISGEEITA